MYMVNIIYTVCEDISGTMISFDTMEEVNKAMESCVNKAVNYINTVEDVEKALALNCTCSVKDIISTICGCHKPYQVELIFEHMLIVFGKIENTATGEEVGFSAPRDIKLMLFPDDKLVELCNGYIDSMFCQGHPTPPEDEFQEAIKRVKVIAHCKEISPQMAPEI